MDILKNTLKGLEKRGIEGKCFIEQSDLITAILEEIPTDATVAFGGSVTLRDLGLFETLSNRGNKVLWHWKTEKEKVPEILKQALFADVYLSSVNAIVEDGRIINIDGTGNRTAAMFFGPKKVILIVGKNKLCVDMDSAIKRIKEVACPKNAERLNRDTPCRFTGKCSDCKSQQRMCTVTTIIEAKPPTMDFKVFLVNEDMGY